MIDDVSDLWAGRTFVCKDTGAKVTLPDRVLECRVFEVGNGFIDVGRRDAYCRVGGNIEEVQSE